MKDPLNEVLGTVENMGDFGDWWNTTMFTNEHIHAAKAAWDHKTKELLAILDVHLEEYNALLQILDDLKDEGQ